MPPVAETGTQGGQPVTGGHKPAGSRLYYGWIVAGVAGLGVYLSGPGQTYSVSTFIDQLIGEFGWSRSLVSSLYSAGTLVAGLLMMLVGRIVDARGYRLTFTAVPLLFALALAFMSTVNSPLALFFGFLMIRTFGQGSMTLIPFSLVPQWFIRQRGRALSLLAIGGALGSATIPHINLLVIGLAGWRNAWLGWAAVLALVMAPLAWKLVRDRPEDVGLVPDGIPHGGGGSAQQEPEQESWTPAEVASSGIFWALLAATSVPSMVITGVIFHHMSIMADNGVTPAVAAAVFTVVATTHMLVTPVAGYVYDRAPIRPVMALALAVGALHLVLVTLATSVPMAVLLGMVHGAMVAFLTVGGGLIWPHYFGRRYLAGIRGMVTAGMVVGSALGPLPFGIARDHLGSYQQVLMLSALLPLAAGLVVWRSRSPVRAAARKLGSGPEAR